MTLPFSPQPGANRQGAYGGKGRGMQGGDYGNYFMKTRPARLRDLKVSVSVGLLRANQAAAIIYWYLEEIGMSKNTSVVLGPEYELFIKAQLRRGRFGSASEAVRAGLALLEERELKVEQLRAALKAGEDSGEPQDFDMEGYLAAKRRGSA